MLIIYFVLKVPQINDRLFIHFFCYLNAVKRVRSKLILSIRLSISTFINFIRFQTI